MNLNPIIQSRVRQLLGLTGGPSIEAIEAIQPVALIAGSLDPRQPQLESGDMLVRRFWAHHSQAAVVAQYSMIQIRAASARTLIWVQRILVQNSGATAGFKLGRTANQTALNWGTAGFIDTRLPGGDLGASLFEILGASNAVEPTVYGRVNVQAALGSTFVLPLDVILTYGTNEGITLQTGIVNTALSCSFEGVAYSVEG